MSAKPCGCDDNAGWVCKVHGDEINAVFAARDSERTEHARMAAEQVRAESQQRFAARLNAEQAMAGTVPAASPVEATPLEEQCIDTQRQLQQLDAELRALVARALWRNDRRHIAEVLATFYRAPLSLSSVQPLLTLAEELNPSLKERA